jgi:hypothetical protein
MITSERIPQWVRDFGVVAGGAMIMWLTQPFIFHDRTGPWWLPVLIMLGVRILDRITQLERKYARRGSEAQP